MTTSNAQEIRWMTDGERGKIIHAAMPQFLSLLEILGLDLQDAIDAVIFCVGPSGAAGRKSNWKRSPYFKHSAPSVKTFNSVYVRDGYRCSKCGTQLRLSVDHIDGDPTNHAEENLRILCGPCNQGYKYIKTQLTMAFLQFCTSYGRIPTVQEVLDAAGLESVRSYCQFLDYLQARVLLHWEKQNIRSLAEQARDAIASGRSYGTQKKRLTKLGSAVESLIGEEALGHFFQSLTDAKRSFGEWVELFEVLVSTHTGVPARGQAVH